MPKDIGKLREALQTIKEECRNHNHCSGCMMHYDHTCGVTGEPTIGNYDYKKQPRYWNIPELKLMSKPDK